MIVTIANLIARIPHVSRRGAWLALVGIAGVLAAAPASATTSTKIEPSRVTAQVDGTAVADSLPLGQCIQKHWWHSMEEDTDEIVVYRPEGYPFPPARGRIGFEFLAGGYLVFHGYGPADEAVLQHGRWEQPGHTRIVIEIDEPGQPVREETWNVVTCSADLLEIER